MGNCYSSANLEYEQNSSPRSSVSRSSSKKRSSIESFKTERRCSQAHPSIWLSDSSNLEEDVGRIQLQHTLLRKAWNADFIAPVREKLQSGIRVLDIGSGMGVWVCERAAEFPKSKFTAIDVLTEVTARPLPPNARFTQNTLQKKLRLDDKMFDYVYVHFLTGYFTKKAWEDLVFKEVVRVTDSGGWIEFVETSLMLDRAGPTTRKLLDATFAWANSRGLHMSLYSQLSRLLESHPHIKEFKRDTRSLPIGNWGGQSGDMALKAYLPLFRITKRQNMEFMSTSNEEYDAMLEKLPDEFNEYRTAFTTYRYIARKS